MPTLAGWLFADLLLVLFVVSLAALPVTKPKAAAHVKPRPTPSPSPILALDRSPVPLSVPVSPSAVEDPGSRQAAISQLINNVNQQLSARHLTQRRAGFVLVFASGPLNGTGPAITAAQDVLNALSQRAGVFHGTSGQGYWQGEGDSFELRIFFFAQGAQRNPG
jgi:hypothetical protein